MDTVQYYSRFSGLLRYLIDCIFTAAADVLHAICKYWLTDALTFRALYWIRDPKCVFSQRSPVLQKSAESHFVKECSVPIPFLKGPNVKTLRAMYSSQYPFDIECGSSRPGLCGFSNITVYQNIKVIAVDKITCVNFYLSIAKLMFENLYLTRKFRASWVLKIVAWEQYLGLLTWKISVEKKSLQKVIVDWRDLKDNEKMTDPEETSVLRKTAATRWISNERISKWQMV